MKSSAKAPAEYLASLAPERREAITALRKLIRKHLPTGYEEAMQWGMLCYQVPLKRCPQTYNGMPLGYVALASQKNYMGLYLMGLCVDPAALKRFRASYKASGKKLDMGKVCLHFKKLDDLPLPLIAETVSAMSVAECIKAYEKAERR